MSLRLQIERRSVQSFDSSEARALTMESKDVAVNTAELRGIDLHGLNELQDKCTSF